MDDLIIECPVHYVYDVKHLYLGSVELLGNLVPQCKHLKGKLMNHSIWHILGLMPPVKYYETEGKYLISNVFDVVATIDDSSQTY